MDVLSEGRRVFNIEINALMKTRDALDKTFETILDCITECEGKVIITGMGKPGHIATKMAATFSSLGTSSFYLDPAEAMHGDLGMVSPNDIVIAISYSGESDEIVNILPGIKLIGARIIGITGNRDSTLARSADLVQIFPDFDEACYLGLAPTSSTTAELVYGDALAVVASAVYGFKDTDFGKYHPAGSLGKKLILKVDDLMIDYDQAPKVLENMKLVSAVEEMSKSVPGMVAVVDENRELKGIITDGDLRRLLQKHADIYSMAVGDVMTKVPKTIRSSALAVDALNTMKRKNITNLPVMEGNELKGIINIQAILTAGIVADSDSRN